MTGEELYNILKEERDKLSVSQWGEWKDVAVVHVMYEKAAAKLTRVPAQIPPPMTAFENQIIDRAVGMMKSQDGRYRVQRSSNLAICPTCKEEKNAVHILAYNQCAACTEAGR